MMSTKLQRSFGIWAMVSDAVIFTTVFYGILGYTGAFSDFFIFDTALVTGLLSILFIMLNWRQDIYTVNPHFITGTVVVKLCISAAFAILVGAASLASVQIVNLLTIIGTVNLILFIILVVKFWFRIRLRVFGKSREPTLIYGAGRSGRQLSNALFLGNKYTVKGFVDDNPMLQGSRVLGHHVYSARSISEVVNATKANSIILAMPNLSPTQRLKIFDRLRNVDIKIMSIPSIDEMLVGNSKLDQVAPLDLEALLGRDRVDADAELLKSAVFGRNILVTGGGGSIGSEICKILLEQRASKIIIYEASEFSLYRVFQELNTVNKDCNCEIIPILGSVLDINLLQKVFETHQIDVVFHAAAYKHVPLVEDNICSAVMNNVFGSFEVLKAAIQANCKQFTLVSSDKAVRPTNVMGATKRVAELSCQAFASDHATQTKISMVRFGNVLGSSGSVIPLFQKQIEVGGPVTVTHKEMIRYFMTIREASELVIQASALPSFGEVFLLDMGTPVKIIELAEQLIKANGCVPNFTRESVKSESDPSIIDIVETGLRPGEKLYEELLVDGTSTNTDHPKIFSAKEGYIGLLQLVEFMNVLKEACVNNDEIAVLKILYEMPIEFHHTHRPESLR